MRGVGIERLAPQAVQLRQLETGRSRLEDDSLIQLFEHEPDDAPETRRGPVDGSGVDPTPLRAGGHLEEHPQGVPQREEPQR